MTASPTSATLPSPQAIQAAYREELEPRRRSILWSWLGFTITFAAVRALTYSIRAGKGPFRNVSVGGAHLHHYLWGIAMVSSIGAVAVYGREPHRLHPATGLTYGTGLALIVDEFALLLDLKDVYWARQGRVSVDLGIGLVALGGTALSVSPVLGRLARDRRRALSRASAG